MNPHLRAIPPSIIRSISARKRPGDVDLGLGEPTLRPEAAPFEAALAWVRENGCPYTPNAGFPELRERLAAYHPAASSGEAERVCVTVGSEEALYLAIKTVIDPALDEVLIVEPCYLAYAKICMMEGVRHRMVALAGGDGFRPDAGRVLDAVGADTRLVVINSPSNPTGRVWPAAELRALAHGLAARSGPPVHVLSDEVYRELYFTADAAPSIAEWYPGALVAGSLSKSNALTGLRLGWLYGPPEVVAQATKVHQFVNTAASTFSQRVAIEILKDPGALAAHRPRYEESRAVLLDAAARAGLSLLEPEGAFYGFLRLPAHHAADSLRASERLLEEERVVTVPGRAFGESGEGWLRLSWVAPAEALREGLARIGRFLGAGA
jgi:aspartate/methionine/tyrosine aminotransferase